MGRKSPTDFYVDCPSETKDGCGERFENPLLVGTASKDYPQKTVAIY